MPYIDANGVKLFYTDQGNGPETIVFAHGLLWSHKMFEAQVAFLKDKYRIRNSDNKRCVVHYRILYIVAKTQNRHCCGWQVEAMMYLSHS